MREDDEQPSRGQLLFFFACILIGSAILLLPGIRIG